MQCWYSAATNFMHLCMLFLHFSFLSLQFNTYLFRSLSPIPQDLSAADAGAAPGDSMSSLPDIYLTPTVPTSPSSFDGADTLGKTIL